MLIYTTDAQRLLDARIRHGADAINLADEGLDDGTRARDVIAHILTALLGPAGRVEGSERLLDGMRMRQAKWVLDEAFELWVGDSENYEVAG